MKIQSQIRDENISVFPKRSFLIRHRSDLLKGFFATAFVAGLCFFAWRLDYLTEARLQNNKDAIAALNSLITILAIILGAFFSYYRFFRNRTFSLRADLSLNVSVHHPGPNAGFLLHAIEFKIKNVGTSTIWKPKPIVNVEALLPDAPLFLRRLKSGGARHLGAVHRLSSPRKPWCFSLKRQFQTRLTP